MPQEHCSKTGRKCLTKKAEVNEEKNVAVYKDKSMIRKRED
jgi:hypothetical protein